MKMTITELRVHMDCPGCEKNIRKALKKLDGVDEMDIDIAMQKVTVMGWIDQKKVLKAVRKTGRRAELWPYPYNPQYNYNFNSQFNQNYSYQTTQPYTNYATNQQNYSSYNYRKHGYSNGDDHGYYPVQPYSFATSLFSDENPHACSIM